ncbi:gliding motility-associated C-terminal domain-containing protein [Flavobacterium proteolyticum]|uniref:Gliding motility-associated C-terminal domain-containing protein n=1 Tax=Flavobacterium proteolyticum TaxID=2911683 RepID=A0ABR9WME9_9FLAO|nr:gliding motility-associated C-terminal domain-containing protein [Flavobacterium proteolyticum]MBE9575089.1 gliding motility-associated C-terminal domain-containing protein [Flavobacterium proteolyticum]
MFFFLVLSYSANAQCDVASFTATPTNGTCFANASISVQVPGAVNCTNWVAILTPPSGSEQQLSIPANGGPVVFNSLQAGSYSVRLTDGLSTVQASNNPISITTSYVSPVVTSSHAITTCNPASANYTNNATLTVNVAAGTGTGPFVYTCAGATNSPSAPTMSRTYTFTGLMASSYNFSVTDQPGVSGCEVTVLQTRVIPTNTTIRLPATTVPEIIKVGCPTTCNTLRLYFFSSNTIPNHQTWRERIQNNPDPNRAMISINGAPAVPMVVALSPVSYVGFGFESPILQAGDTWSATFTDGCDFSTANGIIPTPVNQMIAQQVTIPTNDCVNQYFIRSVWDIKDWCVNFQITIELEDPLMSGTFNPIVGSPFLSGFSNNRVIQVPSAGYYRVTYDDGCHSTIRFVTVLEPATKPLDLVGFTTFNTVRENTGGLVIRQCIGCFGNLGNQLSYPLTYSIMPTNGNTSITYTAAHPYNLAGTFTVNFPIVRNIINSVDRNQIIRDLPGNTSYTITITDACGYSITRTQTTLSATYNPTVNVLLNCANSNSIQYDLNSPGITNDSGTFTHAQVYLHLDNGLGLPGAFVRDVYTEPPSTTNHNIWKAQIIPNIPSGNYVLRFVNFQTPNYINGYGATGNLDPDIFEEFYIPVTVSNYQDISVDLESTYCDSSNPSSGVVLAEITNGTPVYPITWQIFEVSNPGSPLQTFTANTASDSNALQQVFTGLSSGDYFVRTSSSCYISESNITIDSAQQAPQALASQNYVCPGSNVILTGIASSDNLYNIIWTDNFGNTVGSGTTLSVTVTQTTTYTATLTPSIGCVNPQSYSSSVTVTVTDDPDFSLAVSDVDLCLNGNNPENVTISNSQVGFTYEVLDENGNSFVPAITGNGNGGDLILTIPAVNLPAIGTEYTVTTSNGNPGCSGVLTDTILFFAGTLQTNNALNTSDVCINSDGVITIVNSVNGAVYNVYESSDLATIIATSTGTGSNLNITIPASNLIIGTNTFTIQVSGNLCTAAYLDNQATIEVFPNISQVGTTITSCNSLGTLYTVSATFNGATPFVATGTGAPGTWVDNGNGTSTWTSGTIPTGSNYNINIQDTNGCNTINLAAVAPSCCMFEVICPTFPATIVACYADIPTDTLLTEVQFEALGNADGVIGDSPCGVIEIIASNTLDPGCEGNVIRTYTITEYADPNDNNVRDLGEDSILNSQDCTQSFTIERSDFTMPANASSTVACPADVVSPTVPTVTDACGNTLTPSAPVISSMPICEGNVTYSYTFTDCEGNTHDWVYTYTIERLDFTMPANASSTVACPADVVSPTVPTVTDACGNTLTPSAPVISSMPICEGNVTYSYSFTDCEGNTHDWVYTYTIERSDFTMPANGSSTVACPADVVSPTVPTVTDACGNTLTASAPVISSMPTCEGNVTYTYTFTDCEGNTHDWVYTYTIERSDFTMPANASSTVACPADVVSPTVPTVTDACGNTLTPSAPVISSMPICEGNVTYSYTFTDCEGNTHDWVYTYTIDDNIAPTATAPANLTFQCIVNVPLADVNAITDEADNCSGIVTVTVADTNNGGTGCLGSPYIITRTYSLTDCAGNVANLIQTITVTDDANPVFVENLPSDLILECSDVVPTAPILTATDNCSSASVVYNEVRTNGSCPSNYILTRTWVATDTCGNEATHIQTITIQDTTPPVFTGDLPQDGFADCDNISTAPMLTATDNCGSVIVAFDEQRVDGNCSNRYELIRTWTATDDCGNSTVHTQTLTLACHVVIWNAVSPNNDNSNDIFFIEGLDCYPNNTVEIYNRWGIKVFEASNYDNLNNVFKGYSDGRSTISRNELLPTGTYFYILKYEFSYDGINGRRNIEKAGYLYIQNN